MRLANTERGLSALAMRQIYMACVTSIADYGSEIYWNGQVYASRVLQTLQNKALKKILGAFRTSPIKPMEVEAALPPPEVRLQANLWRYATRVQKLAPNHPVKKAIERNQYQRFTAIIKGLTPLERVEQAIQDFYGGHEMEEIKHFHFKPWTKKVPFSIHISKSSKEQATKEHLEALEQDKNKAIIYMYSDASSMTKGLGIGVGLTSYNLKSNSESNPGKETYSKKSNLGKGNLVYNGELEGATQALELGASTTQAGQTIKLFVDNQAAIFRLNKPSDNPGQEWQLRAFKATNTIIEKGATAEIHWVPGHKDIVGNERADKLAKIATGKRPSRYAKTSYAMIGMVIKSEIKEMWKDCSEKWIKDSKAKNTPNYAKKYSWKLRKQLVTPPNTPRKTASAFYQLKLGHGYFKEYLARWRPWDYSNKCSCGKIQTPEHLVLECKNYKAERKELKKELKGRLTMKMVLDTKKGALSLFKFLNSTEIATRKWLLGLD